jgi:hypothetical protein
MITLVKILDKISWQYYGTGALIVSTIFILTAFIIGYYTRRFFQKYKIGAGYGEVLFTIALTKSFIK